MKLHKPVKRWAIGFRVSSKLNRSFNWVEFANPHTFDTEEEAVQFITDTPNWNQHKNQNDPRVKIKYCGPFELTDEEIATFERVK